MLGRSRFVSEAKVVESLTNAKNRELPAILNSSICRQFNLPLDTQLLNVTRAFTKGVGATQCRPCILHLSNDHKIFLKLSPLNKRAGAEQRIADDNIKEALGQDTSPFVLMNHFHYSQSENGTTNEMLFFPFVPGNNLFISLETKDNTLCFEAVGKALAQVHIDSMKHSGVFDAWLKSNGKLLAVLVHDDWQSTNIMITPEYEAKIIDTEGTRLSPENPYRNLVESWEMCSKDPQLMNAFVNGYVNAYPPEIQDKLKQSIVDHFILKFGINVLDICQYQPVTSKHN